MKFFTMWWDQQLDATKESVRTLVSEGRLELLNAGWSMHDEACPHYEDMVNNMMKGHAFVKQEFGVTPRIGWQIDPFGHSATNARLFAEMGFDAFMFARVDYEDKQQRLMDKSLEFIWRPSHSTLGDDAQIFAHVLYRHYSSPDGFNFDSLRNNDYLDDRIVTDPNDWDFNIYQKCVDFYDWIDHQSHKYRSNNILVTMGDDFTF